MFSVKDISQDLLNNIFSSNVVPRIQLSHNDKFSTDYTDEELSKIHQITESKATVVGIDIYQYSQFPSEKQMFIPHLYDLIYDESWHLIKQKKSPSLPSPNSKKSPHIWTHSPQNPACLCRRQTGTLQKLQKQTADDLSSLKQSVLHPVRSPHIESNKKVNYRETFR